MGILFIKQVAVSEPLYKRSEWGAYFCPVLLMKLLKLLKNFQIILKMHVLIVELYEMCCYFMMTKFKIPSHTLYMYYSKQMHKENSFWPEH